MNTKGLETNTQTIERLTKERDEARAACAEMRACIEEWIEADLIVLEPGTGPLSTACGTDFVHKSQVGCSLEVAQKVRGAILRCIKECDYMPAHEALALLDKEGAQ